MCWPSEYYFQDVLFHNQNSLDETAHSLIQTFQSKQITVLQASELNNVSVFLDLIFAFTFRVMLHCKCSCHECLQLLCSWLTSPEDCLKRLQKILDSGNKLIIHQLALISFVPWPHSYSVGPNQAGQLPGTYLSCIIKSYIFKSYNGRTFF